MGEREDEWGWGRLRGESESLWGDRKSRNRGCLSFIVSFVNVFFFCQCFFFFFFSFLFPFLFFLLLYYRLSFVFSSLLHPRILNDWTPKDAHQRVLGQKLSDKRGGPRNTARGETGEAKMRYGSNPPKNVNSRARAFRLHAHMNYNNNNSASAITAVVSIFLRPFGTFLPAYVVRISLSSVLSNSDRVHAISVWCAGREMKFFNPFLSGDEIPLCKISFVASKVCCHSSCRLRGILSAVSAFGLMGGFGMAVAAAVVAGNWLRTLSGLYGTIPAFRHDALIFGAVHASHRTRGRKEYG